MTLEVVDNLDALKALEPEWLQLFNRVPDTTPFQHARWMLTWWAHFGSGRLHVLSFCKGSRIDAILPCFLHEWEGRRQLTLIGTGVSDYLDPLIDVEQSKPFVKALRGYLEHNGGWDICNWQDLSSATPLGELKMASVSPDTPCSAIPLTGSFEQLWHSRSKDMRRNLRRYSERAKSMGPVEFEVSGAVGKEWLDGLVQLHAARWERQGETGMIAANRSEAFLREVASEFAALGQLRFFGIRFKGKIAALVLTFIHNNQVFSYMSAFDPEYEILGFGRTLLYEAIQYSYQNGYSTWNFLRGEEPYKFSWGAQSIPKCRIILHRHTGSSSLAPSVPHQSV
ncbi:MAG: GNAT family N-acetyltransferase [Acidobacteriota bacterium]|nr:GNAT family N-acetyltransferase [Acidobacteriota bacterium]